MATTDVNEDKAISAYREKVARDKLIAEMKANNVLNELFENSEGMVIPAAVDPRNKTAPAVDDKTIKVDYETVNLEKLTSLGEAMYEEQLKKAAEGALSSLITSTTNSNSPLFTTTSGGVIPHKLYSSGPAGMEYVYSGVSFAHREKDGTVTVGVKPVPRTLDVALCAQSLSSSLSDGPDGHIGMESTHDAAFYGEKLMEHYDEMLKGKAADKSRIRVVASTPFEVYLMESGIFWNKDKTACVRRLSFVVETPILAKDVKSAEEIMAEMNKE